MEPDQIAGLPDSEFIEFLAEIFLYSRIPHDMEELVENVHYLVRLDKGNALIYPRVLELEDKIFRRVYELLDKFNQSAGVVGVGQKGV